MDGPDERRLLWTVPDGAPDFTHQDIEVGINHIGLRPDPRVQVLFLDNLGPAFNQRTEQVERLRRQVNLCPLAQKLPCF